MIDISVIIVTFNSSHVLAPCLAALAEEWDRLAFEVIIVDNASSDRTIEVLRATPVPCLLIENDENRGFAAACNQGLAKSAGRHTLLLNPDTVVSPGMLGRLVEHLDEHPDCGIAAPRVLNMDESDQGTARRFHDEWAFLFGRRSLASRVFPNNRLSSRYILSTSEGAPFEADWVSGACLAMNGTLRHSPVAKLDERFFMYWEDEDLCRRVRAEGYSVYVLPDVEVHHQEGSSSLRTRKRMIVEFNRSAYYYYVKHHARSRIDPRRYLAALLLTARAVAMLGLDRLSRPVGDDHPKGAGP